MRATIGPIAAGGRTASIQPTPTNFIKIATIEKIAPAAINPPSTYSYPILSITINAGARNAKLEPRYAGAFPFVIRIIYLIKLIFQLKYRINLLKF